MSLGFLPMTLAGNRVRGGRGNRWGFGEDSRMKLTKLRWGVKRISAQLLEFIYPAKPTQLVRPFVPGPLSAYGRGIHLPRGFFIQLV